MSDPRPLATSVPAPGDATRSERILAMIDVCVIQMMDYGAIRLGTDHSRHLIEARTLMRSLVDEEEAAARHGGGGDA